MILLSCSLSKNVYSIIFFQLSYVWEVFCKHDVNFDTYGPHSYVIYSLSFATLFLNFPAFVSEWKNVLWHNFIPASQKLMFIYVKEMWSLKPFFILYAFLILRPHYSDFARKHVIVPRRILTKWNAFERVFLVLPSTSKLQ